MSSRVVRRLSHVPSFQRLSLARVGRWTGIVANFSGIESYEGDVLYGETDAYDHKKVVIH